MSGGAILTVPFLGAELDPPQPDGWVPAEL